MLMLIVTLLDSSQNKMPQLPKGAGTQLHTDTLFIGGGDQREGGFIRSAVCFFYIAGWHFRQTTKTRRMLEQIDAIFVQEHFFY